MIYIEQEPCSSTVYVKYQEALKLKLNFCAEKQL